MTRSACLACDAWTLKKEKNQSMSQSNKQEMAWSQSSTSAVVHAALYVAVVMLYCALHTKGLASTRIRAREGTPSHRDAYQVRGPEDLAAAGPRHQRHSLCFQDHLLYPHVILVPNALVDTWEWLTAGQRQAQIGKSEN